MEKPNNSFKKVWLLRKKVWKVNSYKSLKLIVRKNSTKSLNEAYYMKKVTLAKAFKIQNANRQSYPS